MEKNGGSRAPAEAALRFKKVPAAGRAGWGAERWLAGVRPWGAPPVLWLRWVTKDPTACAQLVCAARKTR